MDSVTIKPLLVRKYNQPVPRYTSYPTVPFWKTDLPADSWKQRFIEEFNRSNASDGISIYVHLPFCESLCTYCGCNKKITQNHSVEEEYLSAIEKEWKLYRRLMTQTPIIREIHLGGGTPTFFSPKNLRKLIQMFLTTAIIHPVHEFSIEGHPNNTTRLHLTTLYGLGFRRISYGVQDLDPTVQRLINRIQPVENVQRAVEDARAVGFSSVNFDLIYGLPKQTLQSMDNTLKEVITLRPDRIAFYSYAHVPWTSRGQRLFDDNDLPGAEEKIGLYLKGKEMLMAHGYTDIGMDHFALPHDSLYTARQNGSLHRNFMGYTTQPGGLLIGLGVSAISDLGNAFAQNEKSLHEYYEAVNSQRFPVRKGHFLDDEDLGFRKYIKDISCKGYTAFNSTHLPLLEQYTFPLLRQFAADDLITFDAQHLELKADGYFFIRNICSAFDLYLQRNADLAKGKTFSKAI